MCKINSSAFRVEAVHALAGVVSAHLAKRKFSHDIEDCGELLYFKLDAYSISDVDLELIIKKVRAFNAGMRIEVFEDHLAMALYL